MGSVAYHLPTSYVAVTGTVSRSRDMLGERHTFPVSQQPATLESYRVAVVTEGGAEAYTVDVERGWWLWSYKGSFAITVDGRLTSASVESTGTLGTVITAAAGIAGSLLGAVTLGDRKPEPDPAIALAVYLGADEEELAQFAAENPVELDQAKRLVAAKLTIRERTVEAVEHGVGSADGVGTTRLAALQRTTDAALLRIKEHYDAWRATKITTIEEPFEIRVPVGDVPTQLPQRAAPTTGLDRLPGDLADLWHRFGIGVTATWLRPSHRSEAAPGKVESPKANKASKANEANEYVVVRRPDPMELVVSTHTTPRSEKSEDAVVLVSARSRHWVADERSTHQWFELKKSLWGRRSLSLEFDADGFLTKLSAEGDASLPSALTAASTVPGALAGGIESATKVRTALAAAGTARLDAQLSRVKSEVELRQQQLAAAGLTASDAEAARLGRLTSLQKILEAQKSIGDVDPRLVEELAGTSGDDLSWYQRPPAAEPAEPQVVRIILESATTGGADGSVGRQGEEKAEPAGRPDRDDQRGQPAALGSGSNRRRRHPS